MDPGPAPLPLSCSSGHGSQAPGQPELLRPSDSLSHGVQGVDAAQPGPSLAQPHRPESLRTLKRPLSWLVSQHHRLQRVEPSPPLASGLCFMRGHSGGSHPFCPFLTVQLELSRGGDLPVSTAWRWRSTVHSGVGAGARAFPLVPGSRRRATRVGRQRQRDRETQGEGDPGTERERGRDRDREGDREGEGETEGEGERQTETERQKEGDRGRDKERERQRQRQRER